MLLSVCLCLSLGSVSLSDCFSISLYKQLRVHIDTKGVHISLYVSLSLSPHINNHTYLSLWLSATLLLGLNLHPLSPCHTPCPHRNPSCIKKKIQHVPTNPNAEPGLAWLCKCPNITKLALSLCRPDKAVMPGFEDIEMFCTPYRSCC